MAYINSLNFKQGLQQEILVADAEEGTSSKVVSMEDVLKQSIDALETTPLEFTVNRQAYVKKTKTHFLAILTPMVVVTVLLAFGMLVMPVITQNQHALDNFMSSAAFVLVLAGIFAIFPIALGWIPYKNARDNTPEKISVYHDRIVVDRRIFMFYDISQIRMTTPNTTGGKVFRRKIVITEKHLPTVYALGDDTDKMPDNLRRKKNVRVFEDYDMLFNVLWNIFALSAKEGGTNIFSADVK